MAPLSREVPWHVDAYPDNANHVDAYHDDANHNDAYHENADHNDAYHNDAYLYDAFHKSAYHDDAYHDDAYHDDAYHDDDAHLVVFDHVGEGEVVSLDVVTTQIIITSVPRISINLLLYVLCTNYTWNLLVYTQFV